MHKANNKLILFSIPVIFILVQTLFALYHFPLMDGDSIAFLPASVNWANGNGFTDSIFYITRLLNPPGAEAAYINYPPIYPLLNGYLFLITSNLYINAVIIHTASFYLFILLIYKAFNGNFNRIFFVVTFLFIAAWNSQLNLATGRPESLAQVFILLLANNIFHNKQKIAPFFSGILICLIGFTHPVAGICCAMLLLCFLFYKGTTIKELAQYIAGGVLALIIVALMYPYPLSTLINGIIRHGKLVTGRNLSGLKPFLYYHFIVPDSSFYFLLFLSGMSGIVLYLYKSFHAIKYKAPFFITLIFFFFIWMYFTFQTMEVAYNMYVFLPVFGFGILYLYTTLKKTAITVSVILVFLLASTGFARRIILFAVHQQRGFQYTDARKQLKKWPLAGEKTYISCSMFVLFDDLSTLVDVKDSTVNYLLIQQNYSAQASPENIPGYEIIENNFIKDPVTLGGVKIATSIPGYQYALYKKININP